MTAKTVSGPKLEKSILSLLAKRDGSICPSEVAREAASNWRPLMPEVRKAVARLAKRGKVVATQKRTVVDALTAKGPIRVRLSEVPTTPDGRYIVVRERLWRKTNPHLSARVRESLVRELMQARRDVGRAQREEDPKFLREARRRVDDAKTKLGERGPVWWTDGAPDYNRHLIKNTPYAAWWVSR